MKRLVSTALTVALLLGLGALAVLARGGGDVLSPVRTAAALAAPTGQGETNLVTAPAAPVAGQEATAAEATMTTIKWNAIAVPLDLGALTADGVKTYIESFCDPACTGAVQKVAKWDREQQLWVVRGTTTLPRDFTVYPGQALFVGIAGATFPTNSFAWTGGVPPKCPDSSCIRYGVSSGLPSLNQNGWNFLMIPLDKGDILTADALKTDIGNVTKVGKWDAGEQLWVVRGTTALPRDYSVSIGYPYFVLGNGILTTTWPNTWP